MGRPGGSGVNLPAGGTLRNAPGWLLAGVFSLVCGAAMLGSTLTGRSILGAFDFLAMGYPLAEYAQRCVREHGAYPLWLSQIYGGMPFIGSMSTSLHPAELANAFIGISPPLFHAWNALLHLAVSSAGAAALLGWLGLGRPAAVLGGLVYAFGGIVGTLPAVGHVNFLYGCAFLPWILLLGLRGKAGLASVSLAGLLWGLLMAGTAVQFAAFGFPWVVLVLLLLKRSGRVAAIGSAAGALAIGIGLAAAWFAGAAGYLAYSIRAQLPSGFAGGWALVPAKLLDLVWPGIWGRTSLVAHTVAYGPYPMDNAPLYFGFLPLSLAVVGLAFAWRSRLAWILAGLVAFLFSLGPETPWGRVLAALPGYGSFRSWNRWMFFANIPLAILVAEGWGAVLERKAARKALIASVLGLFAVAVLGMLGSGGLARLVTGTGWAADRIAEGKTTADDIRQYLIPLLRRSTVFAGLSLLSAVALYSLKRKLVMTALVCLVSLADVAGVDRAHLDMVPPSFARISDSVMERLAKVPGIYRVESDEKGPLLNMRLWKGSEYMAGYLGSPPRRIEEYVAAAGGTEKMSEMLGVLGVRYVIRGARLARRSLVPAGSAVNALGMTQYLYENRDFLPRIFFASRAEIPGWLARPRDVMLSEAWHPDTAVVSSPGYTAKKYGKASVAGFRENGNGISAVVEAGSGALAVLSEMNYPGWRAYLDGARVRILRADELLMAVEVPPGKHELRTVFDPPLFRAGVLVSFVSLLFVLASFLLRPFCGRAASAGTD